MNVTIFKNFSEVLQQTTLPAVLEQIRDGSFRDDVISLRKLFDEGKQKEYDNAKKRLPAFTPSASFDGGRKMQYMISYSGCIILDIDKLTLDQLDQIFETAIRLPFTYACFRSPGNHGLKILVRSDNSKSTHLQAYSQIKAYYENKLKCSIDPSGKDITRLCFMSWDPELFINDNPQIFKPVINSLESDIVHVVDQIEAAGIDMTNDYKDWLSIGFALSDALGETGRDYFHRISRFNSAYDPAECNRQFDNCLKSHSSGITAKTFFFLAKNQNIDISNVKSCDTSDLGLEGKKNDQTTSSKSKKKSSLIDIVEKFLLQHYSVRYNVVTGKIEVMLKGAMSFEPLTDYMENSIFRHLHKSGINVSMAKLRYILQSDFCARYDPFHDFFMNLPVWDGNVNHILSLAETVRTTEQELWQVCFTKWIVAVVASLLDPEVVNHAAIIFSGAQGIGKTTWMEKLCPEELKEYLFSGTINPNNKDTLIHLSECMLINMDELENMNRTEIGTLKEIITKSAIRMRRSYGHNNENLIRRASFMGSVNTSQFLNDTTGSRRFLCFEAVDIQYHHNIDIKMVYAQAYALWKSGFKFFFDKTESGLISENNEKYQIRTAEEELLLSWFQPVSIDDAHTFYSASQIMAKLSIRGCVNSSLGGLISLGKALKKHGFIKTKKGGLYVWAVKELDPSEVETNAKSQSEDMPF